MSSASPSLKRPSSSPVFSPGAPFYPALLPERRKRYLATVKYLSRAEPAVLASMEPGLHIINDKVAFWIKQAPINECIVHEQLTNFAVTENFGGIILQYHYMPGGDSYEAERPFALFLEPVEKEIKLMAFSPGTKNRVSAELFHSLLWLHAHDFMHGDIRNNNIFLLPGSHAVIGDFDRTVHTTTNFKVKRSELLSLYPMGASVFSKTKDGPIMGGMNGPFDLYTDGESVLKLALRQLEAAIRYARDEAEIEEKRKVILYVQHLQEKVKEYADSPIIQFFHYKALARVMYAIAMEKIRA